MREELITNEYEMLRQEIMQYLEEYQNVRNMMYIITATLLGFGLTGDNTVEYVYLLPLVVIIPSFVIYVDYYNAIVRNSMYLLVFYEESNDFPIKWEGRLRKFEEANKKYDCQNTPYTVCAYVSLALYFISMEKNILNFVIGILAIIACSIVFLKVKRMNKEDAKEKWEEIKGI